MHFIFLCTLACGSLEDMFFKTQLVQNSTINSKNTHFDNFFKKKETIPECKKEKPTLE